MPKGLPFQLDHYLELVDWSGRHFAPRKRGCIAENTPPILKRLGISPKHWLYLSQNFERRFKDLVGSMEAVQQACTRLNKCWVHGSAIAGVSFLPRPADSTPLPRYLHSSWFLPKTPIFESKT